ncbi:MAG: class I SAM-dependent methyltransferase [Anaerolineae bacterium]|nr:class I SAM-dependent methyltransferase [Anaerolineae bacterium]
MPYQDFKDPATAQAWDADNRSYNPARMEQLDMLITLIAAAYQPGKAILDLGIGTGLVEELLFHRVPEAFVVGVDASPAMLARAQQRLQPYAAQYVAVEHDLTAINSLQLPGHAYAFVFSVQTLHHLTDEQMQTAYRFIYDTLEPGGLFLLLDRIAVEKAGLYDCYQHLWARQDRLHDSHVAVNEGATFSDHQRIVAERGDLPLILERHLQLLTAAGFEAACLNLQTNRALVAGRKQKETA